MRKLQCRGAAALDRSHRGAQPALLAHTTECTAHVVTEMARFMATRTVCGQPTHRCAAARGVGSCGTSQSRHFTTDVRRIKNQRQATGKNAKKMACMPSHHNLAFLAPIQHWEPAGSSSPCWCAWAVLCEDWLFQRARGEYDGVFGPLRGWWSGGNCDSGPSRLPQSCARQNPPADAAPARPRQSPLRARGGTENPR